MKIEELQPGNQSRAPDLLFMDGSNEIIGPSICIDKRNLYLIL